MDQKYAESKTSFFVTNKFGTTEIPIHFTINTTTTSTITTATTKTTTKITTPTSTNLGSTVKSKFRPRQTKLEQGPLGKHIFATYITYEAYPKIMSGNWSFGDVKVPIGETNVEHKLIAHKVSNGLNADEYIASLNFVSDPETISYRTLTLELVNEVGYTSFEIDIIPVKSESSSVPIGVVVLLIFIFIAAVIALIILSYKYLSWKQDHRKEVKEVDIESCNNEPSNECGIQCSQEDFEEGKDRKEALEIETLKHMLEAKEEGLLKMEKELEKERSNHSKEKEKEKQLMAQLEEAKKSNEFAKGKRFMYWWELLSDSFLERHLQLLNKPKINFKIQNMIGT